MGKQGRYLSSMSRISIIDFFSACIILSPFLKQYTSYIPGTNLADILLGASVVFVVLRNRSKSISSKTNTLIIFVLYGTSATLTSVLIHQTLSFEIITRLIRFLFYVMIVIVSAKYFNFKYAIKIYKFFCIATAIYLIFQVLFYNLAGAVLPFKVLPLPWAGGVTFSVDDVSTIAAKYFYRPSGVFIEPGYTAQFLLPGLALALHGWTISAKPDYKNVLLVFAALILSTSAQGIFIGALIIGLYILSIVHKNKNINQLICNLIIIFVSLIGLYLFFNIDNVQSAMNKVQRIGTGNSTTLRLYRGFAVFAQLPLVFKIIGLGHGNLGNYVMGNNIITKFDPVVMSPAIADYVNGMSATMLYYGIPGFLLLLLLYYKFLRNTSGPFRLIAITQIVLTLVEGALFNISIVFYFSFIYSGYKRRLQDGGCKKIKA